MTYMMSDVHGFSQLFFQMLETIGFGVGDKLFLLGDVTAKGPDSLKLLRFVEKHENIRLLRGNHEQRLLQTFGVDLKAAIPENTLVPWQKGDGAGVIRQFMETTREERVRLLSYVNELPFTAEIESDGALFFLVHGAPGGGREDYALLENRYESPWVDNRLPAGITAIVGHTPTYKYGGGYAGRILATADKIFLDCGAGQGYGLGCFRLEDRKEFYCKGPFTGQSPSSV